MYVLGVSGIRQALEVIEGAVVISIVNPDPALVESCTPQRLNMLFRDRGLPSPDNGAPRREHARRILEFAKTAPHDKLVIHCSAGVSRSTATAVGVATVQVGITPGQATDEQIARAVEAPFEAAVRAFKQDLRGDVSVRPNEWLTALFDHELRLNGRLLRAVIERYHVPHGIGPPWTWESFQACLLKAATTNNDVELKDLLASYGV